MQWSGLELVQGLSASGFQSGFISALRSLCTSVALWIKQGRSHISPQKAQEIKSDINGEAASYLLTQDWRTVNDSQRKNHEDADLKKTKTL